MITIYKIVNSALVTVNVVVNLCKLRIETSAKHGEHHGCTGSNDSPISRKKSIDSRRVIANVSYALF